MSMSVWDRIEESREGHNVLQHPFYERWTAGELSADELARYSGQYGHAVRALAELTRAASDAAPQRAELRRHAAEEEAHVAIWDGFTRAVGGSAEAEPTAETDDCVRAWTADEGLLAGLARMYAIESGQPEISRVKLAGLRAHYGVDGEEETRYFQIHRHLDVEHAAQARDLLEELGGPQDDDALLTAAGSAFEANWRLLDGV